MQAMKVAPTKRPLRVSPAIRERKAAFRAALVRAGMTAGAWAEEQEITPTYLSHFLAGRHESRRLDEKIAAFVAKHSQKVA